MNTFTRLHRALRTAFRPLIDLRRYRIAHCRSDWLLPPVNPPAPGEVILVTCGFGPVRYQQAALRLASQARRLGRFTSIYAFTSLDDVPGLSLERRKQLKSFAINHPRGWGLWAWKPAVLSALMQELSEGAEVFYIDAGCEISAWGGEKFDVFRTRLQAKSSLFFTIPYLEREWTSEHILKHFGLSKDETSNQIQATWFAILNNARWRQFISSWADQCLLEDGCLLINDEKATNSYLIEHREDQSILSCMLKQLDQIDTIPHEDHFLPELYQPNSWVLHIPIHTLRQSGTKSIIDPLLVRSKRAACKPEKNSLCKINYLQKAPRITKEFLIYLRRFIYLMSASLKNKKH